MNDVRDRDEPEAAWDHVATGFAELGDLVRSGFKGAGKEGSKEELRQAWSGFITATQGLGQAVATSVNDPKLKAGAKQAFGSLVDAIGKTAKDMAATAGVRNRQDRQTEGERNPE